MAVSQKQIAEKLGVSITLVSRVLRGRAEEIGIAPDTIKRVLKAAETMGYIPSAAALSLKGKSTRTIGVAVYNFEDPFFGSLIKQIQIQAHQHNYSLLLAGFLNRSPDEQDLTPLYKHAIDGLIILGSDTNAQWTDGFHKFPIARIGHGSSKETSFKITVDEDDAAKKIIEHLVLSGRKKIACISDSVPAHRLRQASLEKAAKDAGIEAISIISKEKDPFTAGLESAKKIILSSGIDALACNTDLIAMGALHALYDNGIHVPEKIAVTGFDDIPLAGQFIPPITTIQQPFGDMVYQAFRGIIEHLPPQTVYLPGKLIIRETA